MVTTSSLRQKAERKIATGIRKYEAKRELDGTKGEIVSEDLKTGEVEITTYRRREYPWEHYRLVYQDARDFLLKRGWETKKPNLDAQKLFVELIPDSSELKQERESSLKQLRSRDEGTRFQAAKHLEKLARHRHQDETVVRHPDVVGAFIDALQKETRRKSPSVRLQEMLLAGLGTMYHRHLEDYRIFEQLLAFLDSPERKLRITALGHTAWFRNKEKWPHVIDAIGDKRSTQPVLRAALRHVGDGTPLTIKKKLQPLLAVLMKRKLNAEVQGRLLQAICATVDERTVDSMTCLLQGQRKAKTLLTKRIQFAAIGERQEFLLQQFVARLS